MPIHNQNGRGPIPGIAMVLAGVVFVLCSIFFTLLMAREQNPPPVGLQIMFGVVVGAFFGAYVLLVGYVNRDARRRGMRHVLWTFIVLLTPNAIGFIIYFIMRTPVLGRCPRCDTVVSPDFNYCPKCDLQLNPICSNCGKVARPGDQFCPYCGKGLQIQPPAAAPAPITE